MYFICYVISFILLYLEIKRQRTSLQIVRGSSFVLECWWRFFSLRLILVNSEESFSNQKNIYGRESKHLELNVWACCHLSDFFFILSQWHFLFMKRLAPSVLKYIAVILLYSNTKCSTQWLSGGGGNGWIQMINNNESNGYLCAHQSLGTLLHMPHKQCSFWLSQDLCKQNFSASELYLL